MRNWMMIAMMGLAMTQATGCLVVGADEEWDIEPAQSSLRHIEISGALEVSVIQCGRCVDVEVEEGRASLRIDVAGPDLFIHGAGSGATVYVPPFASIAAHGAATVYVERIRSNRLEVSAEDVADITLSGQVDRVQIYAQDAAHVDAAGLRAYRAIVDAHDVSDLLVCAIDTLEILGSGAANIASYCD